MPVPDELKAQLITVLDDAWDDFYVRQISVNKIGAVELLGRPWKTRVKFDEANRTISIELKDDTNPT